MKRVGASILFFRFLALATLFLACPAQAQIFTGTTINAGTEYNSQGLGTYDLSGGSLTLDGSSVFGGGTIIQWNVPNAGGVLNFEANTLTATDGALSITGNPVTFPNPFTLSNTAGTLKIFGSSLNLPQGDNLAAGSTVTISSTGSGYVILGPPFSIPDSTAPEPSTWLLFGMGAILLLLFVAKQRINV